MKKGIREMKLFTILSKKMRFHYFLLVFLDLFKVLDRETLWRGIGRLPAKLYDILICLIVMNIFTCHFVELLDYSDCLKEPDTSM